MKTFVALACSLASVGSLVLADPGDPNDPHDPNEREPAHARVVLLPPVAGSPANPLLRQTSPNDWLALDREINRVTSNYRDDRDGFGWSVLLRGAFVLAHESIATNNLRGAKQGADVAGVDFNDLDFALWGAVRQYGWRLSFDILGDDEQSSNAQGGGNLGGLTFDTGDEIQLEDAYAYWEWGNAFTVTAGNYKFPFTYSTGIDPEHQLFLDRTGIGSHLDQWQAGVLFNGTWTLPETVCGGAALRWYFGIQDGVQAAAVNSPAGVTGPIPPAQPNAQNSDSGHRYALRVEYDFGNGAGAYEGARRSNDRFNATLGVAVAQYETHTASDAMVAIDLNGDFRALGFGLEMTSLGDTLGGGLSGDYGGINVTSPFNMAIAGDSAPWAMMISYLITPDWELGFRLENYDNDTFPSAVGGPSIAGANNRVLSYVVNWYRSGNNAKWQFGYTTVDWENFRRQPTPRYDEGGFFQIGLTLGATR